MTEGFENTPRSSTSHERARATFFEVCDLHGAERDAALERACAGDEVLRVEVLRLLRRDAVENDLLADDAVDSGAAFDAARTGDGRFDGRAVAATRASRLPVEIGGYRILRRIGAGGMGTVYEAEQQDPQRIVALKTLQRWSASPSSIRRFRHEAQVLGRLQHPGIAQIFEARAHDPGDGSAAVPFFVLELIRGKPVTQYIDERNLPIADRLALFIRICDAVAYAHRHGVIHRDLKPDNILVDETGQPKVLDFGIAKTTDSDRQVTTLHTDIGQIIGTLPYMSPEQVGAATDLVDRRSDVYALGVILYEMLTGSLPYEIRDRSIPEAIRVIREGSHTRLSACDRRLRGDLETILTKALEKSAERRYQSVPELSQDVQRHLDHEPISARPPSTIYQLSKFAMRNKALVAGVLGVIIALTLGVIGTTKFAIDAKASASEARASERRQRWSSYLARIDAATAAMERDDVPAARRHLDEAPREHRGWEWFHLARTLRQWAVGIECGAEIVGRVSLLPGDARVVAALADGRVCAWEIASGRMLRSVSIDGGIRRMGDAAAGALVAIATNAGVVVILDMDAGTEVDRWSACEDPGASVAEPGHLNDLAISPDGTMVMVATGSAIVAWNRLDRKVAWRRELSSRDAALGHLQAVTIAANGSLVAASQPRAQGRSAIWAWDLSSGAERGPCRSNDPSRGIAIHPHGSDIAIGSGVRDIRFAATSTMTIDREWTGHTQATSRIAYSPDCRFIASQSADATIRVRDAQAGSTLQILHVPVEDPVNGGLAFSADGTRLVSRGASRIVVWDVSAEPSLVLRGHRQYVYTVAFSPDGTMLASGPFQGDAVRLWDPRSGAALAEHRGSRRVTSLRFTDDGRRVEIRGGRSGAWDTATGLLATAPRPGTTMASEVEAEAEGIDELPPFQPDDRLDANASIESDDKLLVAADVVAGSSGRLEARVPRAVAGKSGPPYLLQLQRAGAPAPSAALAHDSQITSTAFSPGNVWLAAGCDNGDIVIWDTESHHRVATLRRHIGRVYAVAFSPDGLRLASGGNDNSLRLWDTASWDQVLEHHEHKSYIHAVAFSPDGTQLATASGDRTVRVWDSVDKAARLVQIRADASLRDEARPRVAALLETTGLDEAARALRADPALDADHRRAALRVLLELATAPRGVDAAVEAMEAEPPDVRGPESILRLDPGDEALTAALALAGTNRPQIERFLATFDFDRGQAPDTDLQQRIAARWLVANMPGHGFARFALVDADDREIAFDAKEYRNRSDADARLQELEREHGDLRFKLAEFIPDLATATAAELVRNHELAFAAWRSAPWTDEIPFATFLQHILPHRATHERLDASWREAATARIKPVLDRLALDLGRPPTLAEAASATMKAAKQWLRFRQLFALHPTDQCWTEMLATGAGRCEDEMSMALFAGRAAGVVLAGDSTPFWADRDDNHAWPVVLDGSGRGTAKLAHRAAKVLRRRYGSAPGSADDARSAGESAPPGLAGRTALDVTAQYVSVADVVVQVNSPPSGSADAATHEALLCVFNGGAWRPVHWSPVHDGVATFVAMGREVLYMAAWRGAGGVVAAGPPLLLRSDGTQRDLAPGTTTFTLRIDAQRESAAATVDDVQSVARLSVAAHVPHELMVWDVSLADWRTIGRATATPDQPASFDEVPAGGLYWLRAENGENGRKPERPFTVEGGLVTRW